MDYDEFIASVLSDKPTPRCEAEKERTAEDIMAELMPLVEADKKKGG